MKADGLHDFLHRIGRFFGELKDRRVPHATIVYAATAFALLEGAQLIFGELNVPDATLTWLVVVAIAGLPVVIGLSWAYELTAQGVQRTPSKKNSAPTVDQGSGSTAAGAKASSIAVLPFVDLSPGRDQEYFADGISEELINALATVEGLKVVSRTSAFAFRGRGQDVREIGRTLGAQSVLEGSVRKFGNQLRVSTQLVNVADGYQLWSSRFERELADVFAIQDEIASAIVDTLRLRFVGKGKPSEPTPTNNVRAWDHYLKGRHFWYRRYKVGLQTALEYFQAAIAEDPDFAHPYAGVADTFISLGVFAFLDPADARAKAEGAAERALELRPDIAVAQFSMGGLDFFYRWTWDRAQRRFAGALKLDPNHGESYAWWGIMESLRGNMDHAFELGTQAHAVDPQAPYVEFVDALIDFYGKRHDSGQRKLDSVLEKEPELPTALFVQGDVHSSCGRHEAAVEAFGKAAALTNRAPLFLCGLGAAWARAGEAEEAERVLRELQERSGREYVTPVALAAVHAGLGDFDSAYGCIDDAVRERSPSLLVTILLPLFDPIRSDPRYPDLERTIAAGA